MSQHEKPNITVWIGDHKTIRKLRIEAAKRGMTISKYCGYLLRKATGNYTNFDVGDPSIDDQAKRE